MVTGIGLLLIAVGFAWRWLDIPSKNFFGVDIDDHLFFASAVLVYALLVAILVPALIFMAIGAVWKIDPRTHRQEESPRFARSCTVPSRNLYGLVYLAANYRGVVIETFDSHVLRHQLAKTDIDLAKRTMSPNSVGLDRKYCTKSRRSTFASDISSSRWSTCSACTYDPKYGGGFLYFHVHANQYLFGCVIDIEPLEPKDGQLPAAYRAWKKWLAIRGALGGVDRGSFVKAAAEQPPA